MDVHKVDEADENCEVSAIVQKLNEIVASIEENSSVPKDAQEPQEPVEATKELLLKTLASAPAGDDAKVNEIKAQIESFQDEKINKLQLHVNSAIKKYEDILNTLALYNSRLVKASNLISEQVFKRTTPKDYIKLIQVCSTFIPLARGHMMSKARVYALVGNASGEHNRLSL
ncbi:hypothetical protein BEWA_001050 [Theileria equi strain WA]|uniref:Uncharacterized protein n=1 Tax=Theileria equi strain WA TaxID=1537102 RepID=L0AZK4_THEEQ|nr:hypothetical protein BEWA_001050 [Theileria equi strain WA]AFZ80698.1 hypothetical protein BEWA_001050 [Theileria equi strain WA]|eukprot:XP_004830364.1 hypothetical protein BEWA_001050 [Theileria equi strain WA]